MKTFTLFFACFTMLAASAQQTGKKYFFKEIGWTLTLHPDFKTIDSVENERMNERGLKAIEESNEITADLSELKTLIAANKDKYNYFNSTLRKYNPAEEGRYDSGSNIVKNILYKTFMEKMPDATIDSASTNETIDGVVFDKFRMTIKLGEKLTMNMFLLSKHYKGYDFGISYLYLDKKTKEQIEAMLANSTFIK